MKHLEKLGPATSRFLERLAAFPRHFAEILRYAGKVMYSRFSVFGALCAFVLFGGIWVLMFGDILSNLVIGTSFNTIPNDIRGTTLSDFLSSTFFCLLVVFPTSQILYGRFFMSRDSIDQMVKNWPPYIWETINMRGTYSIGGFEYCLVFFGILGVFLLFGAIVFFIETVLPTIKSASDENRLKSLFECYG